MRRGILIVSIILLFVAVSVADTRAATITLRSEGDVVSPLVRLTDVADITGTEPLDRLEALRSTAICSAPPPAEVQVLSLSAIASALRASVTEPCRLKFQGARQVVIRREYSLVSVDELREVFSEYVSGQTGWAEDSFVVRAPKNLRPVPVPLGELTTTVETLPGEDFCGSVLAHFQMLVDGEPYRKLAHRFTIERYAEVLVVIRKIPRGQPVKESDVEITKVEQSRIDEESLIRKEQAVGLLAVRTIHPGIILSAELLTSSPIVQRGQNASVIWEGSGFNIMTKGHVLENGCVDDLVRVRLSSRKIVRAAVLDSKTLRIAKP